MPLPSKRDSILAERESQLDSLLPSSTMSLYGQDSSLSGVRSALGRVGAPIVTTVSYIPLTCFLLISLHEIYLGKRLLYVIASISLSFTTCSKIIYLFFLPIAKRLMCMCASVLSNFTTYYKIIYLYLYLYLCTCICVYAYCEVLLLVTKEYTSVTVHPMMIWLYGWL